MVFIFLCYSTYCFKIHSNTKNFLAVSARIQPRGELKIMNQPPPRLLRISNLEGRDWSLLLWDVLKVFSGRVYTQLDTFLPGWEGLGEQGMATWQFHLHMMSPFHKCLEQRTREHCAGQYSPQVRINKLPARSGKPQTHCDQNWRGQHTHIINKSSELGQWRQQDQAPLCSFLVLPTSTSICS